MDTFNAKEFIRKYKGSFVGLMLRKADKPIVAYVREMQEFDNEVYKIHFTVKAEDGNSKNLILGFPEFKVLPHPDKQLVDAGGKTYLFSRLPTRQFHRGINNSNSRFEFVLNNILNQQPDNKAGIIYVGNRYIDHISFEAVDALYNTPKCPTFKEAITMLEEDINIVSVKLSNIYLLALTPNNNAPFLLFRNKTPIASYHKDNNQFTILKSIYYQEVLDFVRRNNMYATTIRRNK